MLLVFGVITCYKLLLNLLADFIQFGLEVPKRGATNERGWLMCKSFYFTFFSRSSFISKWRLP